MQSLQTPEAGSLAVARIGAQPSAPMPVTLLIARPAVTIVDGRLCAVRALPRPSARR